MEYNCSIPAWLFTRYSALVCFSATDLKEITQSMHLAVANVMKFGLLSFFHVRCHNVRKKCDWKSMNTLDALEAHLRSLDFSRA